MKKLILIIMMFCVLNINAQTNVSDFTNISEVVQCERMTINQIYGNIMQNWSTLNGANIKSQNSLDYCDKESGTINIKTKVYLGFHKCNIGGVGYDGYANAIITYKIKDGRYKVTIKTNDVIFDWTGDTSFETININELYPEFKYKTHGNMYLKKTSKDLVNEKMPTVMHNFFNLCKSLHKSIDDDF